MPVRIMPGKNNSMEIIYLKYLKTVVQVVTVPILLTVLFAHDALKQIGVLVGIMGFVILLAVLVNRYRLKRRRRPTK